jgi:hypothetical protein
MYVRLQLREKFGAKDLGKRKITNEISLDRMVLPAKIDVLGIAVKSLGANYFVL